MASFLNSLRTKFGLGKHHPRLGGLEILKYIGPGLLVTVGFIDPGNWASNLAAGADYGYALLWMVTLSSCNTTWPTWGSPPGFACRRLPPFT